MDIDPRLRPLNDDGHKATSISQRGGNSSSERGVEGGGYGTTQERQQQQQQSEKRPGTTSYPEPPHLSPTNEPPPPATMATNNVYFTANSQACMGDANASVAAEGVFSTDPNNPFPDMKRPRACEACRQLKVRCEQDENQTSDNQPCKRCAKAGRPCVVTMPTRKRQKKTDSRVAELERKIDTLTANLQSSQAHGAMVEPQGDTSRLPPLLPEPRPQQVPSVSNITGSPTYQAGSKRQHGGEVKGPTVSPLHADIHSTKPPVYSNPQPSGPPPKPRPSVSGNPGGSRPGSLDIIDRGSVSFETASKAFHRYVSEMAPLLPMVVFLPGTMMQDIRHTKPTLFHAIVAAAVGPFEPYLQVDLFNDLYKVLGERILGKGEKSFELLQAVLVAYIWYDPPDRLEELKFYQLSHVSVVLAMEMGLCRRTRKNAKQSSLAKLNIMGQKVDLDPESPEVRRTWLSCYFVSVV